jgi:cold shock CspA family protein/ribosome-associated translation inhibitor RaiA
VEVPLELTFRHVEKTEHLDDLIRDRAAKLEKFHPRIVSCRVTVEQPHEHQKSGNPYRVRLEVRVPPGHDLIVDTRPKTHGLHDTLERVLADTFSAMERQLKEVAERQRSEVKHHEVPIAFVVRLFKEAGYGFIKTPEAREIYFQQAATLQNDWERLEIGTQVRFEEAMGEMGPQATTVHIIDKPGHRVPDREPEAVDVPLGWREQEG